MKALDFTLLPPHFHGMADLSQPDPAKPLRDAQHELFAQARSQGMNQADAYIAAGYSPHGGNASRLARTESIAARVTWLQTQAAHEAVLTTAEKRRICREIALSGENRDRLAAIKVDNDLGGDGAEANRGAPVIVVRIGGDSDAEEA